MKKRFSKMLAIFCAVIMVINLVGLQSFAGTNEGTGSLTELTFSNFGLVDDTYDQQVLGTYKNGATLVGTEISGYVTLNEDLKDAQGAAWLSFGYNGWGGLMLYFQSDGSLHVNTGSAASTNPYNYVINPANIQSMDGKNFCGTRFKLTLSMEAADLDSDTAEDDVLLKVYINDEPAVANPTTNDARYGSNGEYYILDANSTHLQGYVITQNIGIGDGYCSDITLESYIPELTQLTFSNFSLIDDTYDQQVLGIYKNGATLVGTEISGYVTLNEDLKDAQGAAWLSFGYNGWGGLMLYFQSDGSLHVNTGSAASTNPYNYVIDPANIQSMDGKNFCGTRFKLTLSMEAADLDSDTAEDDVLLKVYINDEPAVANPTTNDARYGSNGEYYILDANRTHLQGYLITQQIGIGEGYCSDITLESISGGTEEPGPEEPGPEEPGPEEPGPEVPVELTELTFIDFELADNRYTSARGTYKEGESLVGKEVSGYVTLNEDLTNATANPWLVFGGTDGLDSSGWDGVRLQFAPDGKTVYLNQGSATDTNPWQYTFSADSNEGVTTFAGEKFKVTIAFEPANLDNGAEENDVRVKLYINDVLWIANDTGNAALYGENGSYYILNVKEDNMQGYFTAQQIGAEGLCSDVILESLDGKGKEEIIKPALHKATLGQLGITAALYKYNNNDLVVSGQYKDTLMNSVFSTKLTFSAHDGNRMMYGGKPSAWHGINFTAHANGNIMIHPGEGEFPETYWLTPEVAGTTLVGEEIDFKIELFTSGNNAKLGVYINGELYDGAYFHLSGAADAFGSYVGFYVADAKGSITIGVPEPTPVADKSFKQLTFDSYDIETDTYSYDVTGLSVSGHCDLESLDRVVFSDTVQFSKAVGATLRIGGKPSAWHGLVFSNTEDGKLVLNEAEGKMPAIYFDPATAGTALVGKDIKLQLSFEYVDSDDDGKKDDVKLGVWFNGKAYGDRWFYLQDIAEVLGGYCSIYCANEAAYLKVYTYHVPIDYTIWGFTKRWAYELGLRKE